MHCIHDIIIPSSWTTHTLTPVYLQHCFRVYIHCKNSCLTHSGYHGYRQAERQWLVDNTTNRKLAQQETDVNLYQNSVQHTKIQATISALSCWMLETIWSVKIVSHELPSKLYQHQESHTKSVYN